ncbi:hypothetical protein PTSG_05798 [Salpingoeca rosetta]|uniref:Sulfatase N-terminal domain-containing protein n=1 Tax=Salpingoeca rosetta (strain ATCC 50818 / BSB-021) TaxID=946362 RepID=F2UCT8_SALR5|nr:uncharacterized protein PTSG_05798 [Salpingoeca rosetta]EGD74433.1 hypothetical protein PTSG_05798 [Salpingoeca rosetta]|eukprot:XP_004992690.1 hypothetical protein PTSG_05798 [Salpingoeca rosetta]
MCAGPWLQKFQAGGSAGLLRDGKKTTWEGGVREPAFVHWPGRITPNITSAVAATYDILPTVAALTGAKLPTDRIIDGRDLSPVLFSGAASQHDCLFIYKGTTGAACPRQHPNCPGLWAVRCGAYKMHYVTSESLKDPANGTFHDPPLMYQIENDPSENWPLDPASEEYKQQHKIITAAVDEHLRNLKPVPNQMAKGLNKDLIICGCPNSQKQYPQYPNCTCNPENFQVDACTSKIKLFEDEAFTRPSGSFYSP